MMEQDPESTQFTQTQRGKAKVRNGTRWGGGVALGAAKLLEAPCRSSLVLVLLSSSVTVLRQVVQVTEECCR